MTTIAFKKKYLVSEAVGATSLNESYLIADPETGKSIAVVEEQTTTTQMIAKAFFDKALLPVKLCMKTPDDKLVLEIHQPASFFKSVFTVTSADGKILCRFKQRISLFHPGVDVEDEKGLKLGSIEGNWKFKNFQFKDTNGNAIASIRQLFMGFAREFFTTADDYEVDIHGDSSMTLISLAAVICIDFLFHES